MRTPKAVTSPTVHGSKEFIEALAREDDAKAAPKTKLKKKKTPKKTKRAKKETLPPPSQNREKLKQLDKIADDFSMWRPAVDVLRAVRGVPTCFAQVDAITKIGAWPTERVCVVTGPSNEGKTAFVIGLMKSFLQRGHFAGFQDAERTTPAPWLHQLMGELATSPNFFAVRPNTFEDAAAAARQFCKTIERIRKERNDSQLSGIMVVDSIRKLTPKGLLDKLLKEAGDSDDKPGRGRGRSKGPTGLDGAGGRGAQIKAAMNAQWLDELVPLAENANVSIVIITRELGDEEDTMFGKKPPTIAGGKALTYDSSLLVRVTRSKALYLSGVEPPQYIGDQHEVTIRKTKIGTKDRQNPRAHFYTINGSLEGSKPGFDFPRDIFELACSMNVVKAAGAWFSFGAKRLGQGSETAIKKLWLDQDLCREIEAACRAAFVIEGNAP